ncbi:MAG: glycosyltransferase, partial [Chthoniobacterales bacterium]
MTTEIGAGPTLAVCFGQFGPYHHARVAALQELAKTGQGRVIPVQIAGATATYEWSADGRRCDGLLTLCEGIEEAASPLDVFLKARKLFRDERVEVAFLPSYSPARYFALFAAAKSLGIRTVMMNESHAGTEQATGWRRWIKRQIVKRFDAALVGGEPHKRHFASLGIPAEKIFTGYDAVDNALFAARADEVRSMEHGAWSVGQEQPEAAHLSILISQPSTEQSLRSAYGLPERYFLSLVRIVVKKNLPTLFSAYAKFCDESRVASNERGRQEPVALVFVGSGELEGALREQARSLGLRVVDRTDWKVNGLEEGASTRDENLKGGKAETTDGGDAAATKTRDSLPATGHEENGGTVFLYGFRQIEENPVFYALAEAFILPSLKEEWGLVVNEAMACSLPVIVSRTAGCAED